MKNRPLFIQFLASLAAQLQTPFNSSIQTSLSLVPIFAWVVCMPWMDLQAQNLSSGNWRLPENGEICLDQPRIVLEKSQQAPEMKKGRFSYNELSFDNEGLALVFTSGRIGDSTATSSQSYYPMQARYSQLQPNTQVLQIANSGCLEFVYKIVDEQLILQKHLPQQNQLEFLSGTTDFLDPTYVDALIKNVEQHFQCKEFDHLLVTIRNQRSEFPANEEAKIQALELERVQTIKNLFAAAGIVQRDQLQIHTSIAYDAGPQSTVGFEFHKLESWLQNDSLDFEIFPATGAKYASTGKSESIGAFFAKLALTEEAQRSMANWSKKDWLRRLHSESTDFATSLLLYASTAQEIPVWYQKGPMEWKMYAKANDLQLWEAHLEQQFPSKKETATWFVPLQK